MAISPTVRVNVTGARGESQADILRRTGLFGVLPTDDDATAIGKQNADATASADRAEDALAGTILASAAEGVFGSVAAGESATTDGEAFYVAEDGELKLYRNDAGAGVEIVDVATRAALASLSPGKGGEMVFVKKTGTSTVPRTVKAILDDIYTARDYPITGAEIGLALGGFITDIGGAVGDLGFGEILIPMGEWLMSTTALSVSQGIAFKGVGAPIIQWDGAAGGYMFQFRDSSAPSVENVTLLGKSGATPAAAIFYDDTGGNEVTSGTNEMLRVAGVKIGRRWGQDAFNGTGFVRGIRIGGPLNANNDQFDITDTAIWDCSTAGIDIENAQSIWGSIENTLTDTCAIGIRAGSNTQGRNWQFNRNTVADFAPFRDTVHNIVGFNSENAKLLIQQTQNASVFIMGGKALLVASMMTGDYWATFAATKDVSFTDWLVDAGNTTGKRAQFTASSAQRGRIVVRGGRFPNGDSREGYDLIAGSGSSGLRFDIDQGGFRARGTLDGSQTYDPASMEDGETLLVSQAMAAGASLTLGDGVLVSFSIDVDDVAITGNCYANNLIYARFNNESGATKDLTSGKLRWRKIAQAEVKARVTAVHDYGVINNDAFEDAAFSVPCAPGDFVYWGAGIDCRSLVMSAYVSAVNTVKLNATNFSGGNVNLASATWAIYVVREDAFDFIGSAIVDPPSIADSDGYSFDVPVPGARRGDTAIAAFSVDLTGLSHSVQITANDTATVRLQNETGGAVDLASLTARVGAFVSLG